MTPVGPYFKAGLAPVNFITSDYDRAAPFGTGAAKVGGNYAGSLYPHELAVKQGFADCIYLDPATHTKIEEVGPITRKLYETLCGIQVGDVQAPQGWIVKVK